MFEFIICLEFCALVIRDCFGFRIFLASSLKSISLLNALMPLSLYIHIPFCLKRCIYCDFVSGIHDPQKEDAYISAIKKEMLGIQEKTSFNTLYIGGGTPTALSVGSLTDLIVIIFEHFRFVKNYEATIEANPGTIDSDKLESVRSSGINRISIGIQSFNDDELKTLGRLHTAKDAEKAVVLAKETGFKNISIDLIYGIPGQDINSWKSTLEKAASLNPEHISTYELTIEQGTLLYNYVEAGKLEMLKDESIVEIYNHTIDYLGAREFMHYEISNFSKPGYQCRHNMHYWNRGEYYGVGLGAHSFIKGERFFNTDDLENYTGLLSENKTPVKETENITQDKALAEAVFLGLRRTDGISLKIFSETYGRNISELYKKEIKELQEAGLIEYNEVGACIRLTRKGFLLSNEVFTKLM